MWTDKNMGALYEMHPCGPGMPDQVNLSLIRYFGVVFGPKHTPSLYRNCYYTCAQTGQITVLSSNTKRILMMYQMNQYAIRNQFTKKTTWEMGASSSQSHMRI